MDRLFDDFLGAPWHRGDGGAEPAIEVSDTKEAVVVKAQLLGVKKEAIHVDISDNALTLRGETKEET
jgi:HSP20 family protein